MDPPPSTTMLMTRGDGQSRDPLQHRGTSSAAPVDTAYSASSQVQHKWRNRSRSLYASHTPWKNKTKTSFTASLPKVTQIIFVDQDLKTLVVQIPRTFFTAHPHYRSIHHEGLCFEVYRLKEPAESHSTVCTGILRFHPPKTFGQLTKLTAVLTYFAKRNQFTIRLIKDIFSKQLNRMANEVQNTKVPLVDLTTETSQDNHRQPYTSSGKGQYARGFHPYRRTFKTERNRSHHHTGPKSNEQETFSQSSFGKREGYSQSFVNNNLQVLSNVSSNVSDHLTRKQYLKKSDQQMTNQPQQKDLNPKRMRNPSMYSNHLQTGYTHQNIQHNPHTVPGYTHQNIQHNPHTVPGYTHQNIMPLDQHNPHTVPGYTHQNIMSLDQHNPHTVPSINMSSDNPGVHQNEFTRLDSSLASYQTHMGNNASVEVPGPRRAFQDPSSTSNHSNLQLLIPPSQIQNSNLTSLSRFQQNKSIDLDQMRNLHQIQTSSQRPFNQPPLLPLNNQVLTPYKNHLNGTNQAQLGNGLLLQNLKTSQNNVATHNMPNLATLAQITAGPQKIVPTATVNHYPMGSFEDSAYAERNPSIMAPSTSGNHLASNFYHPALSNYRSGHLHPFKSNQNPYLYPQSNVPQWPEAMLPQNQEYPQSQDCRMPQTNSNDKFETPSQSSYQFWPEHGDFQTPSLPLITSQAAQATHQAFCNSHVFNNLSNNLMNGEEECSRNDMSLHSMAPNNWANLNLLASNLKSNDQQSNTQITHAKPKWLTKRISGVTANQRALNIPESSFHTQKSSDNLQQFSNELNTNIKLEVRDNFQSLETKKNPGCINGSQTKSCNTGLVENEPINTNIKSEPKHDSQSLATEQKPVFTSPSQDNFFGIGLIKDEPTSFEEHHRSEEKSIKQNSFNLGVLLNETYRSMEANEERRQSLIEIPDEELDREINDIIYKKFNSPSSTSSGSSNCLVIDENAFL